MSGQRYPSVQKYPSVQCNTYHHGSIHPIPIGPPVLRLWMYAEYCLSTVSGNRVSLPSSAISSIASRVFPKNVVDISTC